MELRQATGSIPLRYIMEFERAGVVRSGFDTVNDAEFQLVANLRAAVERAPETEALLMLGLLLLDDGQLDEAEELLTRVREQAPGSVSAVNGLAVVHYERAQNDPDGGHAFHQKGLALLREAEALDPEDLSVLYNYGKFYQGDGHALPRGPRPPALHRERPGVPMGPGSCLRPCQADSPALSQPDHQIVDVGARGACFQQSAQGIEERVCIVVREIVARL